MTHDRIDKPAEPYNFLGLTKPEMRAAAVMCVWLSFGSLVAFLGDVGLLPAGLLFVAGFFCALWPVAILERAERRGGA